MNTKINVKNSAWIYAGEVNQFPENAGIAVRAGNLQIAVFRFSDTGSWYACDNRCPHKGDMVIARGLIGDKKKEPIVACPMHKKIFSLKSGRCLNDDAFSINLFPVKEENGQVMVEISTSKVNLNQVRNSES